MRPPKFWARGRRNALPALALAPLGAVYGWAVNRKFQKTTPWRAGVPIVCIGNATLGGVGKTPTALAIGSRLMKEGWRIAFLSRGYGGREKGPVRVDRDHHDAEDVGDEPRLLARAAPTFVARDRVAGAQAAIDDGANLIIMDDGYQNPSVHKDVSILLIDRDERFGNGRIFPAGPLRECAVAARERADLVIVVGAENGPHPDGAMAAWFRAFRPAAAPRCGLCRHWAAGKILRRAGARRVRAGGAVFFRGSSSL